MTGRIVAVSGFSLLAGIAGTLIVLRSLGPFERGMHFAPSPTEVALERTMPLVNLNDVPLDEALTTLGKQWGVEITADWPTLQKTGIDRRRLVRLQARDIDLEEALSHVLATPPDGTHAAYVLEQGCIIIKPATGEELAVARVYDLADLMPSVAPRSSTFVMDGPSLQEVERPNDAERMEELGKILEETVDPDSWRDAGGSVGAIQAIGTKLVVTQTWHNHLELRRLLAALRSVPMPPPTRPQNLRSWNEKTKEWSSPADDVQQLLWRQLGPIELKDVPFEQAVARLSKLTGLPIWIDGSSMKAEQLDLQTPVSLSLPSPRIIDALQLLLRADARGRLGLTMEGSVLVIAASKGVAPPMEITRIYDLHAWRFRLRQVDAAIYPNPDTRGQIGDLDEVEIDEVIESLKSQVDPGSWNQRVSIHKVGDFLIVTQSPTNHDQIESILGALQSQPVETLSIVKSFKMNAKRRGAGGRGAD